MAELTDIDCETVRRRYAAAADAVARGCCDERLRLRRRRSPTKAAPRSSARRSTTRPRRPAPRRPPSRASLGCGVPTAVADLHEGETVLDLGSGAGADVLISAGASGRPGGRSAST